MLNIPEYKEYGGETKIALMDNSSLAFMHELSQRSYPSDRILSVYDLILIPKWVMEEIEDSTYRSTYVEQLQAQGYPIRWIDETKYGAFVNDEDQKTERNIFICTASQTTTVWAVPRILSAKVSWKRWCWPHCREKSSRSVDWNIVWMKSMRFPRMNAD